MPTVTCPSCGEKGKIPGTFIGTRIKCKKCGNAFLVTPPAAKAPATAGVGVGASAGQAPAAAHVAAGGEHEIAVEGLDEASWSATPVATAEHDPDQEHHHDEATSSFTASPGEGHAASGIKQYKLLTPKDKYFEGKFDLERLEQALNHFAKDGWVVRSMATPHVAGFSGGEREQLIVLLER
jgi:hypothetical protein